MIHTALLTLLALIAFAANSLLTRAALTGANIGPAEFSLIRLSSGALMIVLILSQQGKFKRADGDWLSGAMLLLYAAAFSFAYISLDTGTGALALFASVQMTMLGYQAKTKGLSRLEIIGAVIAFSGFVYLVIPAIGSPSVSGFVLMVFAGIGWGAYSLLGRGKNDPLARTGGNFWRASLLALPLLVLAFKDGEMSTAINMQGIGLAVLCGAVTSGLGYAVWYSALKNLSTSLAATGQLLVPPLAAIMGWAVLGEALTLRLAIATLVVLLGLYIVLSSNAKTSRP